MRLSEMKKKKQDIIVWTVTLIAMTIAIGTTVLAVKYWMLILSGLKINIQIGG